MKRKTNQPLTLLVDTNCPANVVDALRAAGHTVDEMMPTCVGKPYDGILGERCMRVTGKFWDMKFLEHTLASLRQEKRARTPRKKKGGSNVTSS